MNAGPAAGAAASSRQRSFLRQTQLQAGYVWKNGGGSLPITARSLWERRPLAPYPVVRSDAGELSVGYAGLREGLTYAVEFTEQQRETSVGAVRGGEGRVRGLRTLLRSTVPSEADMRFVGAPLKALVAPSAPRSLIVPMRVHFVARFDERNVPESISKRERWQFRRDSKDHAWTWSTSDVPAVFDEFYERFYRPTMRARYGLRERVEGPDSAYECVFRRGRMFILHDGDQWVGGAVCHWSARTATLTLRYLGVSDGDARFYKDGTFKAMYHLLIDWCAHNGVRALDFQGTESFLSKGTFQWKRRFGTSVVLPPNHFGTKGMRLEVRTDSPAVRDFLVANPMLSLDQAGALEAVYFFDQDRPPRHDFSAKVPGIERIVDLDLDAFLMGARHSESRKSAPGPR